MSGGSPQPSGLWPLWIPLWPLWIPLWTIMDSFMNANVSVAVVLLGFTDSFMDHYGCHHWPLWIPLWTIVDSTMDHYGFLYERPLSVWNSIMDHSIMELSFMITPITLIAQVFRALFAFRGVHNGEFWLTIMATLVTLIKLVFHGSLGDSIALLEESAQNSH
jgi:hypothetical protein